MPLSEKNSVSREVSLPGLSAPDFPGHFFGNQYFDEKC